MRLRVRIKIFLFCLALVLGALMLADSHVSGLVVARMSGAAATDLQKRVDLAVRIIEASAAPPRWDRTARDLSLATGAEVTLFDLDGTVIGTGGASALEGQNQGPLVAPEVQKALVAGAPVAIHDPDLIHPAMTITAPFRLQGQVKGVMRLHRTLPEIAAAVVGVQRTLGQGLILGLLMTVFVTVVGPWIVASDLRELTEAARRMADGDLKIRVDIESDTPYTALARTLEQMADGLSRTVVDLRAERDLLGRILEGMDEGVLVLDEDRRIVLMNRALSSMLLVNPYTAAKPPEVASEIGQDIVPGDYSPLDVTGQPLRDVAPHPEVASLLDRASDDGRRATAEIEFGGLKPRRLLVRTTRLAAAPWGFLMVFVDVTEMRRLESLRRDFVANVSHELRTPVTAVRSAAETVRAALHLDPAAADRFLGMIERNAERLQILVEDLLDLSRIESRAYKLNVEPHDVNRVVTDVLALFRDRADTRKIRLEKDVGILPLLYTDRRALEQVLVNLIDNAVKYCPEDATITVRAQRQGDAVVFEVRDTGSGIEAQHLSRLFERFYRVDAGRSRDRGGTGLGLAIVKHLSEALGGQVAVESLMGKGTTFRVTLPVQTQESPS